MRYGVAVFLLIVVGFIEYAVHNPAGGAVLFGKFLAVLGGVMLIMYAINYPRFAKLRRQRELMAARLCHQCGYDLNGTSAVCPTCRRPFGELPS